MRRFSALVLTVVLVATMIGPSHLPGAAQEATPAPTPEKPQRPTQPETGPGGSETFFNSVTRLEEIQPGDTAPNYWIFVPADPIGDAADLESFPLVIFAPSYALNNPDYYEAWIDHLVKRGSVVLFADFQQGANFDDAAYQIGLQDDVRSGLETLEREDIPIDLTRVAIVGHSLGAGMAIDYVASAAEAGLPVPTAVMAVALGCEGCPVSDLGAIPPETLILMVQSKDDPDPALRPTAMQIWDGLDAVPLENRDMVTVFTDNHVRPALLAVHLQALADYETDRPDALDWYGTWKWLDALMACSFTGEWCEYALGNTPEQRYMGTWSDGVPVKEAIVTDDPK